METTSKKNQNIKYGIKSFQCSSYDETLHYIFSRQALDQWFLTFFHAADNQWKSATPLHFPATRYNTKILYRFLLFCMI